MRLLPAQYVKPYLKRGKNDARDAEAICEAMSRPTMRFVAAKPAEAQAAQMLVGVREGLVRRLTQLGNAIRGHAAEFGVVAARGPHKVAPLLARLAQDEGVPALARELFAALGAEYERIEAELAAVEARLLAWYRADPTCRRLSRIPGVGPIGAVLLVLKAPDPAAFPTGRHFAAWLGLTPKNHSTANRVRLGAITRAGDVDLRAVLVAGAMAVVQQAQRGRGSPSPWLGTLLESKAPKEAAVALANKTARIAWKLMVTGAEYDPHRARGARAEAA